MISLSMRVSLERRTVESYNRRRISIIIVFGRIVNRSIVTSSPRQHALWSWLWYLRYPGVSRASKDASSTSMNRQSEFKCWLLSSTTFEISSFEVRSSQLSSSMLLVISSFAPHHRLLSTSSSSFVIRHRLDTGSVSRQLSISIMPMLASFTNSRRRFMSLGWGANMYTRIVLLCRLILCSITHYH